jgi:hypothetical protein
LKVTGDFLKSFIVEEHTDFYALTRKHAVWGHHFSRNRYQVEQLHRWMNCI